jgi:hypothetical protein
MGLSYRHDACRKRPGKILGITSGTFLEHLQSDRRQADCRDSSPRGPGCLCESLRPLCGGTYRDGATPKWTIVCESRQSF